MVGDRGPDDAAAHDDNAGTVRESGGIRHACDFTFRPARPTKPEASGAADRAILEHQPRPATDAELRAPFGVAVTADGGFLIADTFNQEVRNVAAG